jgi:hypothetical protein
MKKEMIGNRDDEEEDFHCFLHDGKERDHGEKRDSGLQYGDAGEDERDDGEEEKNREKRK